MLVSNKHFIPVIGLDIHIVILFGFPIPLPHPYIGFVMDPMDYIPFLGATTKINHVPRGKSDTSGIIIILFHFPMGGPWLLAPMIGHDSVNFFGSKKVKVEGTLMSPSGHMLMTCNDIGIPLSLQPGKKLKPIPSMYLPTSFSIPLSFGKPVMVGGPFVPDWAGALMNLVMSFGFGALMKGAGKGLKKLNHALQGKMGSNKLSHALCKMGFEPVDLVQGIVVYDGIDFELPGPIPLKWERSWNSDSPHRGLLGHGTHCSYDMRVQEFPEEGATVVLLGDGRSAVFEPLPFTGDADYHRHEKLTLTRTDLDEYQLYHHAEKLCYTFRKPHSQEKQYRLSAIHNDAGFIISLHYNSRGHLLRIIDSAGRHLHITSDTEGRITRITAHHRGQERLLVRYAYNEAGDLAEITDANDQSIRLQYRNHLMTAQTDRSGQRFYWEYDGKRTGARCVHTWGDGGLLEGFIEYHPEKGYNLVTNSKGLTSTYYYTPDHVVTQIKDPMGHSRCYEYTEHFELYREIDEEGNVTGYTYDERGNCTGIEQPDGSAYAFAYDDKDRLVLATNPEGGSRTYIYRPNGLLHTITEADGSIQILRYNQQNLLHISEDEQGRKTVLEYDEDHNLNALTLPDGGRSTWEYDAWGQCLRARNPLQQEQLFQYDSLGRVTEISMPDGNRIKLQYNANDEVLQATDKHHQVRYDYTPLGSLKMREENGAKLHFIYDTEEELTTVVNEHGESYRFIRDGRGDIIQETGFDGVSLHYQRDAAGKVIKAQRPGNRWTEFEYDLNGQLSRISYSDGSWQTYSYNRNGQLMEAVNEHSTVKLQRDRMGRVTEEWQNGHRVSGAYDGNGWRKGLQSSLGADIRLQRDALGDITGIQAGVKEMADPWVTHIQRNLLGLEIERTLPGGVRSSWAYDPAGMPASHTVGNGQRTTRSRHYRWDANQRLKQIVNSLSNGKTQFGHDDLGNLAWAQYEDGQYDYRLPDKAGNLFRTQERRDRKYGPGGRLLETPQARFSYDEEGKLVSKHVLPANGKPGGTWRYEWYGSGMLKKVWRPDNKAVEFEYDGLGRRTAKIFNGAITRWLWDGNTPLHEWIYEVKDRPHPVIDELGNISAPPEPVPAETLVTWVFEEDTFVPAAKIVNGRRYSIIADHLGTPCEAYDEEGEKVWECELDIYGKIRKLAGQRTFVPFRYQGQYEDAETGLYYNNFRYYSPDEGIYLNQDPIRLEGGIRLYGYVHDPLIWLDAFGLACHGNSKASTKPNHVYEIVDKNTGEVYKYGISGGKIRMDGKSYRAEKQVRKLNSKGGNYESRIVAHPVTRQKALNIEQGKVNAYSVSAQRAGATKGGRVATPGTPIAPVGNIKPPATM